MDTLRRALEDVERDLRLSESELERLTARVMHLRQAAAGLRGLVTGVEPNEHATVDVAVTETPGGEPERVETTTPRPPVLAQGVTTPDSYDGALAILMEHADQEVHIDLVRHQFRERGWIRPDWSNPDSAIYAALVRATKRDEHVERTARRLWRYNTDLSRSSDNAETSGQLSARSEVTVAS